MDDVKRPRRRPQQPPATQHAASRRASHAIPERSHAGISGTRPPMQPQAVRSHVTQDPPVQKTQQPSVTHIHSARQPKQETHPSQPAMSRFSLRRRTVFVISGLLLLSGIAIAAVLFWLYSMKQVRYDNGVGMVYDLTFYRRSYERPSPDNPTIKTLTSRVSRDNKEPLTVTVTRLPSKPDDSAIFCYTNSDKKIVVKNTVLKKDIHLCPVGRDNELTSYTAIFESEGSWHRFVAQQYVNTQNEDGVSPADLISRRSGVAVYRADIEAMVASIRRHK